MYHKSWKHLGWCSNAAVSCSFMISMFRLVSPLALSLARVRSDTQHPTVQTVTSLRPKKHLGSKSPKPRTAVMKQLEARPSNRSSSSSSKTRGNSPENDREKSNHKHLNLSKSSSSSSASLSSIAASGWLACEKSEMLVAVLISEAQYKIPFRQGAWVVRQQPNNWMQSKHFLVCARRIHDALPPKFHVYWVYCCGSSAVLHTIRTIQEFWQIRANLATSDIDIGNSTKWKKVNLDLVTKEIPKQLLPGLLQRNVKPRHLEQTHECLQ